MAYVAVAKRDAGKSASKTQIDGIIDNQSDFQARVATLEEGGLINRSFEAPGDVATEAASWTKTLGAGGTIARVSTDQYDGQWAMKFTRTSGGGNAAGDITSDLFPFVEGTELDFGGYYKTDAGVASKVTALFFDEGGVSSTGTAVLAAATTLTTEWTPITGATVTAPAGTRYAAIKIEGATSDVDVAGSAYFDAVELTAKTVNNFNSTGEFSTPDDFPAAAVAIDVWIPDGASTVEVFFEMKTNDGGEIAQARAIIGANLGTSQTTNSTSYVDKSSVITIGSEFGWVVVSLQYGQQDTGGTGDAFILITASGDLTEENIEVN